MRSWKRLGYADRRLSVDRGQLNAWKRPQPEQSKLLVQNGKNAETVSWECSVVCVDNPLVSLNALRKRPEASQNGSGVVLRRLQVFVWLAALSDSYMEGPHLLG